MSHLNNNQPIERQGEQVIDADIDTSIINNSIKNPGLHIGGDHRLGVFNTKVGSLMFAYYNKNNHLHDVLGCPKVAPCLNGFPTSGIKSAADLESRIRFMGISRTVYNYERKAIQRLGGITLFITGTHHIMNPLDTEDSKNAKEGDVIEWVIPKELDTIKDQSQKLIPISTVLKSDDLLKGKLTHIRDRQRRDGLMPWLPKIRLRKRGRTHMFTQAQFINPSSTHVGLQTYIDAKKSEYASVIATYNRTIRDNNVDIDTIKYTMNNNSSFAKNLITSVRDNTYNDLTTLRDVTDRQTIGTIIGFGHNKKTIHVQFHNGMSGGH
jgi:hypothetical protein